MGRYPQAKLHWIACQDGLKPLGLRTSRSGRFNPRMRQEMTHCCRKSVLTRPIFPKYLS